MSIFHGEYFNLIDGVVAGENYEPLQPEAKNVGIIIAGFNSLIISIIAKMIGYTPLKITTLKLGFFHPKSLLNPQKLNFPYNWEKY